MILTIPMALSTRVINSLFGVIKIKEPHTSNESATHTSNVEHNSKQYSYKYESLILSFFGSRGYTTFVVSESPQGMLISMNRNAIKIE